MVEFRQKTFSEYDAMRSLYVELMKRSGGDRNRYKIISQSEMIPILKGNNVVIERFVITTSLFKKDRYRMYLKVGAKAKMPDEVRLPGRRFKESIGQVSIKFNAGGGNDNNQNNNNGQQGEKKFSVAFREKVFSKNKNKGGGGGGGLVSSFFSPTIDASYYVDKLLGDAVKYDKKSRSIVLEFDTIDNAIDALNILPFGLNYKIYLLDA